MPGPILIPPALRDAILDWYVVAGRGLPFRATTDPYAILVSEAMAQQTQAARAGEAWLTFMTRFPTVRTLAAASPGDVLRAWQGLGYNRRALNLWRAAGRIATEFGGVVPRDLASLESLPGVGPYTARAVAAIAFGAPVGAVDTNVRRVLGRIVAGEVGVLTSGEMQRVADAAVPRDRSGAWTHALMDIGATVCRPGRPDCAACPARPWCRYADRGQAELPTSGSATAKGQPLSATARPLAAHAARARQAPFRSTSRWLRGRILDRLREVPAGDWVDLGGPIGEHDSIAIGIATRALAHEGLLELDGAAASTLRARLPLV